jgi:uncharacterized protein YuzE
MKAKYFPRANTAFVEFGNIDATETRAINDNIIVEMDMDGQSGGYDN